MAEYIKTCEFCGHEFTTKRIHTKYCPGTRCRDNAWWADPVNRAKGYSYARDYKQTSRHYANVVKSRQEDMSAEYILTDEQWNKTLKFFNYKCVYCGHRKILVRDHFIPHKLGGLYTWSNMVPACSECNARKNAKHPKDFCPLNVYKKIVRYLASLEVQYVADGTT